MLSGKNRFLAHVLIIWCYEWLIFVVLQTQLLSDMPQQSNLANADPSARSVAWKKRHEREQVIGTGKLYSKKKFQMSSFENLNNEKKKKTESAVVSSTARGQVHIIDHAQQSDEETTEIDVISVHAGDMSFILF